MKILAKDRTLLLSEAACQEELYYPDEEYDDDDLEDELYDVDELEDDVEYTEEMVNVIAFGRDYGNMYIVEYDNLLKLMESKECNEIEAMRAVAECNGLEMSSMALLIESQTEILEKMEEMGAKGGNMLRKNVSSNATKKLKDLKKQGLNIVKKKDKKKTKKKSTKKRCR